ncbi:MAG: hypothetical protein JW917_00505 [Ignavibacteria bacterium]|nr:hypothetical protein [Ignavibacteria bacterium]
MKKIIISALLTLIISCGYTDDRVYIGMTNSSNTVLLEDNNYSYNESLWEKNEFGSTYESYLEYINNFLESNIEVKDLNGNILFDKYHNEFSKLTDIRIGEKFFVSNEYGVFESKVQGYIFHPDDSYTSSNVFYVLLEVKNNNPFEEGFPVIISKNASMSVLKPEENSSSEMYETGMEIIKRNTLGKEFTSYNYEDDRETREKFKEFIADDYKLFKGKFTQNTADEYIINFSSRFSFMYYINATYIITEEGEIIAKITEPQEKDFSYYIVKYVADIDNDGIDEILTEIGYYEGTGLYIYKFDGKEHKKIAEGFIAGV